MPTIPRPRFLVPPSTFDAVARIRRAQYTPVTAPIQEIPVPVAPVPVVEPLPVAPPPPVVMEELTVEPVAVVEPVMVPDANVVETPAEETETQPVVEDPQPVEPNVIEETVTPVADSTVSVEETSTPDWDPEMKKSDLLAFAVSKGVDVKGTDTKAEIAAAIKAAGF